MARFRLTLSIRTILIAGFGGLTAVGIVVALVIGLSAAFNNTQELLAQQADGIVSRIDTVIYHKLNPVERQAQWIAARVSEDKLSFRSENLDQLSKFFEAALSALPQISGVAVVTSNGMFHRWSHEGHKLPAEDWSWRKNVMAWLKQGAANPPAQWGPPIWLDSLKQAVILFQKPLFDSSGYLGYLSFAVPISGLSAELTRISPHPFVLVGKTDVLAHPTMINWQPVERTSIDQNLAIFDGASALLPLKELGDPVLDRIWDADYQDLVLLEDMTKSQAVAAAIGDRQYVFLFRQIERYGEKPWTIGTYIDTDQNHAVVKRMGVAVAFGAGLLLIAVIASLVIGRAIGRPIRLLARAAEAVRAENLDDVPNLQGSPIKELGAAMTSFNGMVAGLVERNRIRATLGRYVPKQVADVLLQDGGGLKPTESEATVLFCDLAGFTALTEALGPIKIVEVLNAYFSRMTEIIEDHDGVITQFQGDAILAIFNVPIKASDHAESACEAAMEMCQVIKKETFAGQVLQTRIGINTGSVVAGAVGAEGRLSYTVHGDAVNRAARLEAMNKEMGTSILISETTAAQLTRAPVEKIGEAPVRGQANSVTIYSI